MQRLFDALGAKHDGAKVLDVRFTANPDKAGGQAVDEIDRELAEAVRDAIPVEFPGTLCGD